MMKNSIWILLLIFGFLACNDDDVVFEPVTEGLEIKFTPVAGGAMMHYSLPNDRNIFAMNVRYKDWQGVDMLKVSDYGSDSLLLDGFTGEMQVVASVSFVNHRNEESARREYTFSTLASAPWAFFEDIKVGSTWNGFQVIYQTPNVTTGMAHVFYLGENPLTHQPDTIPVSSFPIRQGGDTLKFEMDRKLEKYTVVVRTEDFRGYRVKQEIYPDIDAFLTEQWTVTADDFNTDKINVVDNDKAKTGVKYLFDGDLKGRDRMEFFLAATGPTYQTTGHEVYGTFLAGPNAFEKPMVLDLREQKTPAWLRLYGLIPTQSKHAQGIAALGSIWAGWYDNKLPCKLSVYGNNTTADPEAEGWVYLGGLNQDPKAETASDKWSYPQIAPTTGGIGLPKTWAEFNDADPMYVDVLFPVEDNTYRYLKIIVHGTFDTRLSPATTPNTSQYITLHELEVFVKKN